jgi:hypothetical protein
MVIRIIQRSNWSYKKREFGTSLVLGGAKTLDRSGSHSLDSKEDY